MKKVNFTQNGYDVSFDANGDPVAKYELVNWQKSESGSTELVTVGHYDASLPAGQEFRIIRNITWVEGGTQVRSEALNIYFAFFLFFQRRTCTALSGTPEGQVKEKKSSLVTNTNWHVQDSNILTLWTRGPITSK